MSEQDEAAALDLLMSVLDIAVRNDPLAVWRGTGIAPTREKEFVPDFDFDDLSPAQKAASVEALISEYEYGRMGPRLRGLIKERMTWLYAESGRRDYVPCWPPDDSRACDVFVRERAG